MVHGTLRGSLLACCPRGIGRNLAVSPPAQEAPGGNPGTPGL